MRHSPLNAWRLTNEGFWESLEKGRANILDAIEICMLSVNNLSENVVKWQDIDKAPNGEAM